MAEQRSRKQVAPEADLKAWRKTWTAEDLEVLKEIRAVFPDSYVQSITWRKESNGK